MTLPTLTALEIAKLGATVIEFLEEVNQAAYALRQHDCPQCAEELKEKAELVWRALDPLLVNGPAVVYSALGVPMIEEDLTELAAGRCNSCLRSFGRKR